MADNVVANSTSGGSTFATDDIGGVHYPRTKVVWGADGAANDASAAAPLPVVQTGSHAVVASQSGAPWSISAAGGSLSITGTVAVSTANVVAVSSAGGSVGITGTVAVSSAGGSVGITGTVAVSSAGGSVGITGTVATSSAGGSIGITGTVATSTAPLTATAQAITAKIATDAIQDGLTALTPKFAAIAVSGNGANTLVVSVSAKKIRVLAYNLMAAAAVNGKFTGNATDLTGLKYMAANGGLVAPFNPVGWFETGAGSFLGLNLSAGNAVGGELTYVEV